MEDQARLSFAEGKFREAVQREQAKLMAAGAGLTEVYGYTREDASRALTIREEIRRLRGLGVNAAEAAEELTRRLVGGGVRVGSGAGAGCARSSSVALGGGWVSAGAGAGEPGTVAAELCQEGHSHEQLQHQQQLVQPQLPCSTMIAEPAHVCVAPSSTSFLAHPPPSSFGEREGGASVLRSADSGTCGDVCATEQSHGECDATRAAMAGREMCGICLEQRNGVSVASRGGAVSGPGPGPGPRPGAGSDPGIAIGGSPGERAGGRWGGGLQGRSGGGKRSFWQLTNLHNSSASGSGGGGKGGVPGAGSALWSGKDCNNENLCKDGRQCVVGGGPECNCEGHLGNGHLQDGMDVSGLGGGDGVVGGERRLPALGGVPPQGKRHKVIGEVLSPTPGGVEAGATGAGQGVGGAGGAGGREELLVKGGSGEEGKEGQGVGEAGSGLENLHLNHYLWQHQHLHQGGVAPHPVPLVSPGSGPPAKRSRSPGDDAAQGKRPRHG